MDEPSIGEVSRQLADWRDSMRQDFANLDRRLQELATATLPAAVFHAERTRIDDRLAAMAKTSDERFAQLIEDIAEIKRAQDKAAVVAHERAKTIASNRFVFLMALATTLLFPLVLFGFEHWLA